MSTVELIPAKQILDNDDADTFAKGMGWDSFRHFDNEVVCELDSVIGRWYMDMDDDLETDPSKVTEVGKVRAVTVCGMPSRCFFVEGTLYRDKEGRPYLNMKEVG